MTLPSRIRPSPENPPLRRPKSGGLNEPTTYILVVGGFQNVTSITFFRNLRTTSRLQLTVPTVRARLPTKLIARTLGQSSLSLLSSQNCGY